MERLGELPGIPAEPDRVLPRLPETTGLHQAQAVPRVAGP
jgi:hypothetical protein